MNDQWGVGNAKDADAFDRTYVGENPEFAEPVELIFGEHPHSRSDDNIYARWESGEIEGFSGHRLIHEVRLREYNYLKTSGLSGNEVRRGGQGVIYINGHVCGEFFFRDIMEALLNARDTIQKIHDHPIQLWDKRERDSLVGRKVWWKDEPAIITMFIAEQACVVMEPDGMESFRIPPRELEDDGGMEPEDSTSIKDTIFSPHIWWWREST